MVWLAQRMAEIPSGRRCPVQSLCPCADPAELDAVRALHRRTTSISWSLPPSLSPAESKEQGWHGISHPGSAPARTARARRRQQHPNQHSLPWQGGHWRKRLRDCFSCQKCHLLMKMASTKSLIFRVLHGNTCLTVKYRMHALSSRLLMRCLILM